MTLEELINHANSTRQTISTGTAPASSGKLTLQQVLDQAKTSNAPVMSEQPAETLMNPEQQISSNFHSGKINAADAVIQDVGEAARQTNEALFAPWSPLGWINTAVQKT